MEVAEPLPPDEAADLVRKLDSAAAEGRGTRKRGPGAEIIRLDAGRAAGNGGTSADDLNVSLGFLKILGHNRLKYFIQSQVTGQILVLSPREITIHTLPAIADLAWWKSNYPIDRPPFVDVDSARSALMEACHRVGIFQPDQVRGRGIWWDEAGHAAVHDGAWVTIAGRTYPPWRVPGPSVYEYEARWPDLLGEPLDDGEGRQLLSILERFPWRVPGASSAERGLIARLVAGWCVIAPVCGALRWRPNLNVAAPAEAGKSFLARNLFVPLLGPTVLHVEGDSSEAGLRQALGRDARVIVWDEAEGQGNTGQARLHQAMAFARRLSSGGRAGGVVKGTTSHQAKRFDGVACMVVLGIFGLPAERDSDEQRWVRLELERGPKAGMPSLPVEFGARLRGRTVAHLQLLRDTHEVFARAGEQLWGSRREGDQLGALLAGAHLLCSSEPISPADAIAQLQELPASLRGGAQQSDEERCLARLASWILRLDTHSGRRQVSRAIGELVAHLAAGGEDEVAADEARKVLRRHGIAVTRDGQHVAIAKRHDRLTDVFAGSDFAGGYARMLERLSGAETTVNKVRFGPGCQVLAVRLPIGLFNPYSDSCRDAADPE